ncbi:MAG: BamA/TamA family outer membrane protein [Woeseiaceae bacterium]|nr:BamA/TamA family outer membrane protein [Woeseiaceae bacterium]
MTLRRTLIGIVALLSWSAAPADVEFVVRGVGEPLEGNILSYVDVVQFGRRSRLSTRDLDKVLEDSIREASLALRPYGFYEPEITGRYIRHSPGEAILELTVDPGPPMVISDLELSIEGPGAGLGELMTWQRDWPLRPGQRLDQVEWENRKQGAIEIARTFGYLSAAFDVHVLELDLDNNTASVRLRLQTGERYVMGDIDFGEHVLAPGVVENVARFDRGDPYSTRLMDDFRTDLWKTGYFTDVDVREFAVSDVDPPRVDLAVGLETLTRNRYQGAIGYGTDTGFRLQANFSRHPMSHRGDRLDLGIGWQELDDEFRLVGTYRLPRRNRRREYWVPEVTLKFENQDLEFKRDDSDEDFLRLANGDLTERHFRFGRLKVYNIGGGEKQMFATPFVQYLDSERRFALVDPAVSPQMTADDPAFDRLLNGRDNALSFGVDVDVVSVIGTRFRTRGHRDRAWAFIGDSAFGADFDFAQFYVSTRRSYVYGERTKLLLRAEAGYTDAEVDNVTVDATGGPLSLSVTRLPNFYRFKAGGSQSVRGYGFEQLSNNNVGSNHILTASAEVEYRFLENWSGAVFADIGNAFNDWNDTDLKLGVGVGIRWYSIAGPIRIDVAQARDFDGKPWRIHFTIGTPLL